MYLCKIKADQSDTRRRVPFTSLLKEHCDMSYGARLFKRGLGAVYLRQMLHWEQLGLSSSERLVGFFINMKMSCV